MTADLVIRSLLALAVFLAVGLFVWSFFRSIVGWLRQKEQEFAHALNELFFFDFSPQLAAQLSLLSVLSFGFFFWLISYDLWGAVLGAVVGFYVPKAVMWGLLTRRRRMLEQQLTDALLTIANGVRANLNLVQSLQLIEQNMSNPIKQEVGFMLREYEHGVSIEDAMGNAAVRLASPNYRLMFSALKTNREKGGDLGETLDRIAESLREIDRLEKKIDSTTAQGRYAAMGMGLMALIMVGMMYWIEPRGMVMVWLEAKWLFGIAAALTALGFYWIWRIVNVDI